MSDLTNQLAIAEKEEVGRGIRYLLAEPLLTARSAPDRFDVVRRRRVPIAAWFDTFCGWGLIVEPRVGYARLRKVRTSVDPTRPARRHRSQRTPFDRRRYVLLCVVAAELCTVPVTTIGILADNVAAATANEPLISGFDPVDRAERRAFVDVLRLLESFGVLETVDGSSDTYVDSTQAKVLYRVDNTLLLRLLVTTSGPSQLGVPAEEVPLRLPDVLGELTRERRYGAAAEHRGRHTDSPAAPDAQRNLWLRHSVFRRLVEDPVLYFDTLTDAERAYLATPTGRQMLKRAADTAGFVLEERAEGVMFVDPEALSTDQKFPDDAATAKVAALLLLEELTGPTTVEQLRRHAAELLQRFPRWARSYRTDDGPGDLVTDALAVLTQFQLVRTTTAGLVVPLPAAARYRVQQPRLADPTQEQS
ncbi:TIGR02678 family protein [Nocardia sp. BSTN01]|uniref:TIGR02678 family protein n=1 Tax=Nocardia sp. BSTN01 TaxID=2783665 RepID=UPI00188F872F|nr:TIGR02678 family protein [Nocardia sp. BSTN01]MBF4999212.1 TIGR02678 family protein [Nocardia sp. BSTN01]